MGRDFIFQRTCLFHDALRVHVSPSWCWYHQTHSPHLYLQSPFTAHQPTQNKMRACNSRQAQYLTSHPLILRTYPPIIPSSVCFFFFCLAIKWHYGCISKATECSHSTEECLIRQLSTTPLTGNEMVSRWMWSIPVLHWWAEGWLWLCCFPDVEYDDVWKLSLWQIKWEKERKGYLIALQTLKSTVKVLLLYLFTIWNLFVLRIYEKGHELKYCFGFICRITPTTCIHTWLYFLEYKTLSLDLFPGTLSYPSWQIHFLFLYKLYLQKYNYWCTSNCLYQYEPVYNGGQKAKQ